MPKKGESAALFIETVVRDDAINLYGFAEEYEKNCFNILTAVQGVGAKLALAILSSLSPDALNLAIASEDAKALNKINGVGAKLAARLITELKDKMGNSYINSNINQSHFENNQAVNIPSAAKDAVSALANLGYQKMEALMAVNKAIANIGENASLQNLIKEALKEFGK